VGGDSGASYITFHPEATNHIDRSLSMIRQGGCKAGLVFNPSTSLDICTVICVCKRACCVRAVCVLAVLACRDVPSCTGE